MGITTGTVASALGELLVTDADANVTSEDNAFTGSCIIYVVEVDNTANAGQTNYIKIANATSATTSSTKPVLMLVAPAGEKVSYMIHSGVALGSGASFWCTQTIASETSQSAPSSTVTVKILGT